MWNSSTKNQTQKPDAAAEKRNSLARQRMSEVLAKLEYKIAQHNLTQTPNEDGTFSANNPPGMSILLPRRRFESFMEAQRIISRPIAIIRASQEDILHLRSDAHAHDIDMEKQTKGKDELLAIPILPADEMETLTSDIKLWFKHQKLMKVLFSIGFLAGLALFINSIFFSVYWYAEPPLFAGNFNKTGSAAYNIHMCGQFSVMCIMSCGMMVFRLLPHTRLKTVINVHAVILSATFAICLVSMKFAFANHEIYTRNKTHFYSLHSWIGIIALSIFCVSIITGVLLVYYPNHTLRRLHAPCSSLTFMMCGAGTVSGFFVRAVIQMGRSYTSFTLPGVLVNICGVLLLAHCVFVRFAAVSYMFRRRPKPRWDVVVFRSLEAIEDIFLDIHGQYDSYEEWVGDVNRTRMKAVHIPHAEVKSQKSHESKRE